MQIQQQHIDFNLILVFKFEEAKKIIAYLAELGISDLYASPIF